jgi:putative Ca2+/H+ antiporter (TMEM165/GDT1 family)
MDSSFFQHGAEWPLFFSTFAIIFLAELPDKTALAILILASRRRPFPVYIGVCSAYVVQNTVAVFFGSLIGLLPAFTIHMGSGVLFLIFAFVMLAQRGKKEEPPSLATGPDFLKTIWASFMVIFVAEWGDLTQLATATLVAQTHRPLMIFTASTLALWVVSGIFVIIGFHIKKVIRPHILRAVAALAFAVVGILLLTGFWDK